MKKIKTFLFIGIVLLLLVITVFGTLFVSNKFSAPTNQAQGGKNPTPNMTALALWTPTPNAPNQVQEVIATVWPTPITRIIPADREAFRTSFQKKLIAQSIDWSLLSSINHAGVAWRCTDIKIGDLSLPASTSGTLVAVWATWYGGVDNKDMKIEITDGQPQAPILNEKDNTYDIYKSAKVAINFPVFGIVGPEIMQGNEIALIVDKPSILYGIWTTPREWITGEDIITQKQVDNVNFALDWAKIDSIAPLMKNGERDDRYLSTLFDIAQANLNPQIVSVTLPDGNQIIANHSLYETLMNIATIAAQDAGYAKVESLTITINKPQGINDYHYLANTKSPVIPPNTTSEMTLSSCPLADLSPDTILEVTKINLPDEPSRDIITRLIEIFKQ